MEAFAVAKQSRLYGDATATGVAAKRTGKSMDATAFPKLNVPPNPELVDGLIGTVFVVAHNTNFPIFKTVHPP